MTDIQVGSREKHN